MSTMGKHHSSSPNIDDSIADFKIYWDTKRAVLGGVYEVVDIEKVEEKKKQFYWMRLEQDLFYPEGGGQPGDNGWLFVGSQKFRVVDTQSRENHSWIKVISPGDISVGTQVKVKIDEKRRDILSKNHSGQHLLSATFYQHFDADTVRAELGIAENQIDVDQVLSLDDIQKGFEIAIDMVAEDLDIETKILSSKDLEKMGLRGSKKIEGDVYRLVQIGDDENPFDLNLCGGTHVPSTSQIMGLALTKLEGKKIRFVCGLDALKFLNKSSFLYHRVQRTIGVNSEVVPFKLEELLNSLKTQERDINKLEEEVLRSNFSLTPWVDKDGYRLRFLKGQRGRKNFVSKLASELKEDELLIVHLVDGLVIFASGSEELVGTALKKGRELGIKGGGKGRILMGKVPDEDVLNKLIEVL